MLTFPQLSTGASAQYPVLKRRSERTIINISEDGRVTSLVDTNARTVAWDLAYSGLTDHELLSLTSFYALCEGPLQSFLFCDPTQNLLAYSEDYSQSAWVYSPFLVLSIGTDDPFGTNRASSFVNTSQASLTLTQTVSTPGTLQCVFSAYIRQGRTDTSSETIKMTRTDGSTIQAQSIQLAGSWTRVSVASAFASSVSTQCDFSLTIPGGASIDVFGLQVDAQPSPGKYVTSTSETGVFPNARFDMNEITASATDLGQSSLKLSITSRAGL